MKTVPEHGSWFYTKLNNFWEMGKGGFGLCPLGVRQWSFALRASFGLRPSYSCHLGFARQAMVIWPSAVIWASPVRRWSFALRVSGGLRPSCSGHLAFARHVVGICPSGVRWLRPSGAGHLAWGVICCLLSFFKVFVLSPTCTWLLNLPICK